MPVRNYRALLAIVVFLIAYGSFYPFELVPIPNYSQFLSIPPMPYGLGDIVLNIFLYLPVGFLACRSFDAGGRRRRVIAATLTGTLMSAAIEGLQGFIMFRASTLSDIVSNGTGTLAGALLAVALPVRPAKGHRHGLQTALLVTVWGAFQVYPLLPDVSRQTMARSIAGFRHWSWLEALLFAADWLAALLLAREALPRARQALAMLFVLLVPVKMILFQRRLTSFELAGALAALVIFAACGRSRLFATRVLPVVLIALLVVRELAPFRFGAAGSFNWLPFGASLTQQDSDALLVLVRKAFVYGSAIWFVQKAGMRIAWATLWVSVLLLALEWIERWIPGRTPEITDAVLAALMGAVLALSAARSDAQPAAVVS